MADSLSDRVRRRLKEEMNRRHLSQRDVADLLNTPEDQPRISRLLTGEQPMRIDDLEALAFAVGLAPTEAVRDHGLEFCAEMTPTELRLLESIRALAPNKRDALLQILDVKTSTAKPDRHAGPLLTKKLRSRS